MRLGEQTVVWGHSQGGHAALWTGQLAPTSAPELDIAGVAALAPASNLPGLIDNLGHQAFERQLGLPGPKRHDTGLGVLAPLHLHSLLRAVNQ